MYCRMLKNLNFPFPRTAKFLHSKPQLGDVDVDANVDDDVDVGIDVDVDDVDDEIKSQC